MFNLRRTARTLISLTGITFLTPPLPAFELQMEGIAQLISTVLQEADKGRVAVVDFTDLEGRPSPLGSFLAEELSVALVSAATDFEVVDRLHLQTIMSENEIRKVSVFESETTRKLLELTAVDALVTGRLTVSERSVRINVKVLDAAKTSLLGAVSESIERVGVVDQLVARQEGGEPPAPTRSRTSASFAHETEAPRADAARPSPGPERTEASSATAQPLAADDSPPEAIAEEPAAPTPAPSTPAAGVSAEPESAEEEPRIGEAAVVAVAENVGREPREAAAPGIGIAVAEPITLSVQALRTVSGRLEATLKLRNNTSGDLEWHAARGSRLSDSRGAVLTCTNCRRTNGDGAVLVPAGTDAESLLRFAADARAAALERRDAFAFFFDAKTTEAERHSGPFTLFVDYEFAGPGGGDLHRARAVFTDLPAEEAVEPAGN